MLLRGRACLEWRRRRSTSFDRLSFGVFAMSFSDVERAVQALRDGKLIIVVDDADRENEGDFICAAQSITPDQVDFMLKIGRGTMCVPMSVEEAERLNLKPVIDDRSNTAPHKTAFLTMVDHQDAGTR